MDKQAKLGILGGMGPQATQVFYQFVLDRTDAAKDQEHLPAVILSDTGMPDRTAAILSGDTEGVYRRLLEDAKLLEGCGCTALAAQGKKRPGILATDGTIQTGLYQRECAAVGLEAVSPGPETQRLVMSVIYDEIKRGETGSRDKFARIDRAIRRLGCDCAVLACTELSVFSTYHPLPPFYVDAMAVLAEKAVTACGYPLRAI